MFSSVSSDLCVSLAQDCLDPHLYNRSYADNRDLSEMISA